jgi:hypothetical protein
MIDKPNALNDIRRINLPCNHCAGNPGLIAMW